MYSIPQPRLLVIDGTSLRPRPSSSNDTSERASERVFYFILSGERTSGGSERCKMSERTSGGRGNERLSERTNNVHSFKCPGGEASGFEQRQTFLHRINYTRYIIHLRCVIKKKGKEVIRLSAPVLNCNQNESNSQQPSLVSCLTEPKQSILLAGIHVLALKRTVY